MAVDQLPGLPDMPIEMGKEERFWVVLVFFKFFFHFFLEVQGWAIINTSIVGAPSKYS